MIPTQFDRCVDMVATKTNQKMRAQEEKKEKGEV